MIGKYVIAITVAAILIGPIAFDGHTQELTENAAPVQPTVSEITAELAETLQAAYESSLLEYRQGRAPIGRTLRLSQDWFDVQRSADDETAQLKAIEAYRERGLICEDLALKSLGNGTGTSIDFLEAKAARLTAELDLANRTSKK